MPHMTPKKCIVCENYQKVKQFEELRSMFNNWCNRFERPVALCKCNGNEIAIKYLEEKNNTSDENIYNIFKINLNHY